MLRHGMNALVFCLSLAFTTSTLACTGIELFADDGSAVNGRTFEFGTPLNLSIKIIPRGYAFLGTLPDETGGLTYRVKYGAVGATSFDDIAIIDGINEKGLSVAAFYFPGSAQYAALSPANKIKAVSPTEFSNWIITQFATVDEVKASLNHSDIAIVSTKPKGWPGLPPLHYIVYDNSGKSIVIEPIKGRLRVYDNPIGAFSNAPGFSWHLMNLSNFVNLSPINPGPSNVSRDYLKKFGNATSLHGLPGDFTSPSRFIRAAVFSVEATPASNAAGASLQAFHLLNQFDIPVGTAKSTTTGKSFVGATIATTVKDSSNIKYYYRTSDDQAVRVIDLSKINMNDKTVKTIPMTSEAKIEDVTASAK